MSHLNAFVANLCGRGDKDIFTVADALGGKALRNDFGERKRTKLFEFNPKRGAAYFAFGLIIFPVTTAINYFGDCGFGWELILGATLIGATLAGVLGTFTEHVGL